MGRSGRCGGDSNPNRRGRAGDRSCCCGGRGLSCCISSARFVDDLELRQGVDVIELGGAVRRCRSVQVGRVVASPENVAVELDNVVEGDRGRWDAKARAAVLGDISEHVVLNGDGIGACGVAQASDKLANGSDHRDGIGRCVPGDIDVGHPRDSGVV